MSTEAGVKEWLPWALDEALKALQHDETVLVHCLVSKHRTGAFYSALPVHREACVGKPFANTPARGHARGHIRFPCPYMLHHTTRFV